MVALPTLDVTQAQADRLLLVFAGPNGTTAEAVANYKQWLKGALLQHVLGHEANVAYEQANETALAKLQQVRGELGFLGAVEQVQPSTAGKEPRGIPDLPMPMAPPSNTEKPLNPGIS